MWDHHIWTRQNNIFHHESKLKFKWKEESYFWQQNRFAHSRLLRIKLASFTLTALWDYKYIYTVNIHLGFFSQRRMDRQSCTSYIHFYRQIDNEQDRWKIFVFQHWLYFSLQLCCGVLQNISIIFYLHYLILNHRFSKCKNKKSYSSKILEHGSFSQVNAKRKYLIKWMPLPRAPHNCGSCPKDNLFSKTRCEKAKT